MQCGEMTWGWEIEALGPAPPFMTVINIIESKLNELRNTHYLFDPHSNPWDA